MIPTVPIYSKYLIKFHHSKGNDTFHIYAENDDEFYETCDRILDFDKITLIEKNGILSQSIHKKHTFVASPSLNDYFAYVLWSNRKYYNSDSVLKSYLMECFERLEEYEICCLLRDNESYEL